MIASIDMGGTNTHGVLIDGKTLKSVVSFSGNSPAVARKCYTYLKKKAGGGDVKTVLTGGGSMRMGKRDFPMPFRTVNEIRAIGRGGMFLSGKKDVFVVSIGTGTAFVSVKKGKPCHVGGTGIGGGTIHGLSRLILGMPLAKVEGIAKRAKKNLDLTVGDIVGRGIGKVPASATASNFGRAMAKSGKPAVASSLLKMIGETIGVMAYFAAKGAGQEKGILICGRVAMNGVVKSRVLSTIRMLGGRAAIPKKAEFCAAIGAALESER
jgi:type II pantothenate kinase